jgi:long-chain acyl-CoA synthetase
VPFTARLHYKLGEMLVYGPLKNVMGFSKIRVGYTAGEAIGPELFSFYRSIGLNLKQLYGQTEAFLYVTCQPDGQIRSDTVGPPAPNVEIKISEDGEVLYKSPGMFVGYFKEPEKTAETMTPGRLCPHRRFGLLRQDRPPPHHRPRQGCRQAGSGALFAPKYLENKLKFYPQHQGSGGLWPGRGLRDGVHQHRHDGGGQLGRAQQRRLCVLSGAGQPPRCLPIIAGHVDEVNKSLAPSR